MASPRIHAALLTAGLISRLLAGPFPPAAGQPGSDAIPAADTRFTLWATAAEITRGPANIASANPVPVSFGGPEDALGPADATTAEPYTVVSLGDGGSATLTFAAPFGDVPGPDFAVFENSFSSSFLELAHVEVSSDGVHFFRFPSTSLTPASANIGEGGSVDPTNIRNLAGKYLSGYGTPFDLAELRSISPELDIQRITQVRVIDAIGTNNPAYASRDSTGAIVIDPYPTNYYTGGFDLDAVGAFSTTCTTYAAWTAAQRLVDDGASPTADPDRNGVQNLIEYLTGNGTVEIVSCSTFHFSRLSYRTGGNLKLEASADLRQWTALAGSINGAAMQSVGTAIVAESGNFRKDVTVQLPANSPYRFFRLSAELAP